MNSSENIFLTPTGESSLFYADPSLEEKTSGTCDLYLLIDTQIKIALKERRSGNILAVEILTSLKKNTDPLAIGWKNLLEGASAKSKVLRNYEFLKVTAGIVTSEYTLVPEALYRPADEKTYFRKNFSMAGDQEIRAVHVPAFHLYVIFAIDTELKKELDHLFQDPQIIHFTQSFLAGLSPGRKMNDVKQMWLNLRGDKADIVVAEGRKLLLMNTFTCHADEDILYYILFVAEQLQLSPDSFPLTVTGDIEVESPLHKLLGNYIRTINFPSPPSGNLPETGRHRHSVLYNLTRCE